MTSDAPLRAAGLVIATEEDLDLRLLYESDWNALYLRAGRVWGDKLDRVTPYLPACEHGLYPSDEVEADRFSWFLNTYACDGGRGEDLRALPQIMCLGGFHDVADAYQTNRDGSPWYGAWGELVPVYCIPFAYRDPGIVYPW